MSKNQFCISKKFFFSFAFLLIALSSLFLINHLNKNKQITKTGAAPPRIIGGHLADPGEWPFMVALYDGREKDLSKIRDATFCGGFLISNEWILTAAHCLYRSTDDTFQYYIKRDKSEIAIAIGYYNLRDIKDKKDSSKLLAPVEGYAINQGFNYKYHYNKLIKSEDFAREAAYFNEDIALLRIKRINSFYFVNYKTISLSNDEKIISPGTPITILGWGGTENDIYSDVLYKGFNTIYSNKRLIKYENKNIYDNKILIKNYPISYFGDSGGPIITYSAKLKKWVAIGIGTWVDPGNKSDYFTNLIYHLPWIKQVTGIGTNQGNFFGSPPDFITPTVTPARTPTPTPVYRRR